MDVIGRNERRVYLRASVECELLEMLARKYGSEGRALATLRVELQRVVSRLTADQARVGRIQ